MAKNDSATAPTNLPTASSVPSYILNGVNGNGSALETEMVPEEDTHVQELENRAHTRHTLLSSDAIRHFINHYTDPTIRLVKLDYIIDAGKVNYPTEDGWLVLNLSRMQELCAGADDREGRIEVNSQTAAPIETIDESSLAEAILTSNFKAALLLTENRPMMELAHATAELDALYRLRQGQPGLPTEVSELLKEKGQEISMETLLQVIKALNTAIDGTYTDEKVAVKTALFKAMDALRD